MAPPHRGFRIKSHTPSGFHVGIAQAEAHESGARFSVVFSPETLTLPSP
jgi:hypothetical protein